MISNFRIEIKKLLKIESDVNGGEMEEDFFPEDDGNNCQTKPSIICFKVVPCKSENMAQHCYLFNPPTHKTEIENIFSTE